MLKVLAADIGGTNSRFARIDFDELGEAKFIGEHTLRSQSVSSFALLLAQLREEEFWREASRADCFVIAITGPVQNGEYCRSVNLPWDIDLRRDAGALPDCPTWMINDFLAQAFATLSPVARGAEEILKGEPRKNNLVSVVGAGTGLGVAFLVPDDQGRYSGCPSEGGHGNFAPESEDEFKLIEFALRELKCQQLEWEDFLSGRGLQLIHNFFYAEKLEAAEIAKRFSECPRTFACFSRIYGRMCRNISQITLPFGGLYIAGGIAAKNPQIVFSEEFRESFLSSKSYREVLERIPVRFFDDEKSGLWGAAWFGRERTMAGGKHGG